MDDEIGVLQVEKKLEVESKGKWIKLKKNTILNEQMKAIQKELGESTDTKMRFLK